MPRPARATSDAAAPAPRALRARGQLTRRKLLDAGGQAFAAKGYHATRVDDVVKLARTSHGTFYLYFANKEELFRALAEEVATAMADLATSLGPLEPSATGRAALRSWIADVCALYDDYGPVIRAWTEAEIGGNEVGRLGTDVLTQFTRVVYRRVEEVAPPDLDAGIAALALVAMLERLNYYVLSGQVDVAVDAMVDTLARVIHGSLFGA
jgi:AcrR family transcriptional regulator